MNALLAPYDAVTRRLSDLSPSLLPTLARIVFAGVLLFYFWNSAQTKLGEGLLGFLSPSDGAYIQIFPKAVEAVGYDTTQLSAFHYLVVVAGTLAELILPLLIVIGLFTRLAALDMIGFTIVQSLTDVYGHGVGGDDLGRWFDAASGSLVFDQRGLWMLIFAVLLTMGAGPLSLDRLLSRNRG